MRYVVLLLSVVLVVGVAAAQQAEVHPEKARAWADLALRPGGEADRPPSTRAFSESGTFNSASPTYDRILSGATSLTCNAPSNDSINDGMSYVALRVEVTAAENLVAEVIATGTTLGDPVLSLYCDPFDPAAPMTNLVAFNDDISQNNKMARFLDSDGITLQPGATYWLVLTTFSSGDFGTYQVDVSTPTATPVEVQSFSID